MVLKLCCTLESFGELKIILMSGYIRDQLNHNCWAEFQVTGIPEAMQIAWLVCAWEWGSVGGDKWPGGSSILLACGPMIPVGGSSGAGGLLGSTGI